MLAISSVDYCLFHLWHAILKSVAAVSGNEHICTHVQQSVGGTAMSENTEELLTLQEVAGILRVDQTTVRRWIKEGTLPSIKLPHRGKREIHRVRRSTLNTILRPHNLSVAEAS